MRGTLAFMAPEVFRLCKCSEQSDIYSVGMVLYWLLNFQKLPFSEEIHQETAIYKRLAGAQLPLPGAESNESLRKALKETGMMDLIENACAYETNNRISSFEELRERLEKVHTACQEFELKEKIALDFSRDSAGDVYIAWCESDGPQSLVSNSVAKEYFSERHLWSADMWGDTIEPYRPIESEVPAKEKSESVELRKVQFSAIAPKSFTRVVLTSSDIEIEDNEEEQEWFGEYLRFGFVVMLPEKYQKKQISFKAAVYINDVIATNLRFVAQCNSLCRQEMEVTREDIFAAFISYASQDRARVASIVQGMQKARKDMKIFMDIENLRSISMTNYCTS